MSKSGVLTFLCMVLAAISLESNAASYYGDQDYYPTFPIDTFNSTYDSVTVHYNDVSVGGLDSNNQSAVFFSGFSQVNTADAFDSSTINFTDYSRGTWVSGYNSSVVNASGQDIEWLQMYDTSTTNIYGGMYSWINLFGESTANIFGGFTTSWFQVEEGAQVNVFGEYLEYRDGRVFGMASDGSYFNFELIGIDATGYPTGNPVNVTLNPVPLPPSIFLFLSGMLGLFRFRSRHI
jgi:hypothetical protein